MTHFFLIIFCNPNLIIKVSVHIFVKVYQSGVEGTNKSGNPLGRWEDRVKEYLSERGVRGNGLGWARMECMEKERWRSVCCAPPPLGTLPEGARRRSY